MPVYPTPPGTRFDLGIDGTRAFIKNDAEAATAHVEVSNASIRTALMIGTGSQQVQRTGGAATYGVVRLRLVFPEPRTILGVRWCGTNASRGVSNLNQAQCLFSTNWTDLTQWGGATWTNINPTGHVDQPGQMSDANYRSWAPANAGGVVAMEFLIQATYYANQVLGFTNFSIYGQRDLVGDRLAFWDPVLNQPLPGGSLDFGDIQRGQISASRPFRVKNIGSLTANGVTASYDGVTGFDLGGNGAELSADDVNWSNSPLNLGNLAPGAISPVCFLRLGTAAPAVTAPGVRAGRMRAIATSWT